MRVLFARAARGQPAGFLILHVGEQALQICGAIGEPARGFADGGPRILLAAHPRVAEREVYPGIREGRSLPLSELREEEDDAVSPDRFFGPASPHAGRWMRPPEPWADDLLEQAETLAVVRAAIERLSGLRRQVITLRDVEGWSAKETCSLLGITEGNQRILLHRARSRVRAELERHFAGRRAPAKSAGAAERPRAEQLRHSGRSSCAHSGRSGRD